ncbi:MAG: molybdopterin-binding protein [Candidatus Hadarchaeum sp.]|uniref:molybdenum cofactor synthesis domain-containing protein n=1 Tax=Candidatus Hadarchaeum sp. TaxID=2883567 RepID=UPI00318103C4
MAELGVISLEEAKAALDKFWKPKPRDVYVSFSHAIGRVSSTEIKSKIDVPPFDRATYDGFAVKASDTFGATESSPIKLKLVGRVLAGTWPRMHLRPGSSVEITTGAPLPRGADAVVMSEYAVVEDGSVNIYRSVSPWENVTSRGSDIKKGQIVIGRLKQLNLLDVAVLAAIGVKKIMVKDRPKVAVISTGSELVEPGAKLRKGKIYDVNATSLSESVRACGGEPVFLGTISDRFSAIKAAVSNGIKIADVVLISGGSSVGTGDLTPRAIATLGRPGVIVHGIAMKPGKPTFIAVVKNKPIFGLPGYPVSALMVFDQLVADYLHELSGIPRSRQSVVQAKLATKLLSARGRQEFVPVKLVEKDGQKLAEPILKGSGAITSLSTADGYIEVPLEREIVEEGESVEVKLFRGCSLV